MNWHETIEFIRKDPEYAELVEHAYFEADLVLNVERFRRGEEFAETLAILNEMHPSAKSILEIGAGNGVAAINFALNGFHVTAVEPDPSDTVGAGAIKKLIEHYHLDNVEVFESYAEEIGFKDESFDIIYIRQAMHHAYDLRKFINESARVLKSGGFLVTIRDHVIFNEEDKELFLQSHPLHKFYGGENAFRPEEYKQAFNEAGLEILQELKYYDSVINYFPATRSSLENNMEQANKKLKQDLENKISILAKIPGVLQLYKLKNGFYRQKRQPDESTIPGRMYSYITRKK